jgi:hypothetical protein
MKITINDFIRPRRRGVKDAVKIKKIETFLHHGITEVGIDTDERHPEFYIGYGNGPAGYVITIHFHDQRDDKHFATTVSIKGETEQEDNLLRSSHFVTLRNHYGPLFAIIPYVPSDCEATVVFDAAKKRRKAKSKL